MRVPQTIIIGSGIGGLTTAALLLQGGHRVTVLEAHMYPGGSAGTFYNRGYRFDAGATLAGGFSPGGPHARLAEQLGLHWPIQPVDPAWVTHLPGMQITQWTDQQKWEDERQRAFPGLETFWQKQERLARISWDIASRPFPWPPDKPADLVTLTKALRPATLRGAPYLLKSVASMVPRHAPAEFRTFLDAQLLISSQAVAQQTNALYGSAALDLPRRGVNNVRTGIGALSQTLVNWIRENGGKVLYRQPVNKIIIRGGKVTGVETSKGLQQDCDFLVANLTPWGLANLFEDDAPAALIKETRQRPATWGAFTLYLGLDESALPAGMAEHQQVIVDPARPLGEGNSVFLSISPANDPTRAPAGMRAATVSTHTVVGPWWELAHSDPQGYAARKEEYTQRVFGAIEHALPGFRRAVRLALPGTPLTFQYYTNRPMGMVGGFAQTSLLNARGAWTGVPNAWLVGDSVFPGQSTAGVTLGGWRVAESILRRRP
jgi:C-3',4' desaturase CrtD